MSLSSYSSSNSSLSEIKKWSIGYYPNLDQIEYALKAFTIRDKSLFYSVLAYLEDYMAILPYRCENEIERILPLPSLELKELVAKFFVDTIE